MIVLKTWVVLLKTQTCWGQLQTWKVGNPDNLQNLDWGGGNLETQKVKNLDNFQNNSHAWGGGHVFFTWKVGNKNNLQKWRTSIWGGG